MNTWSELVNLVKVGGTMPITFKIMSNSFRLDYVQLTMDVVCVETQKNIELRWRATLPPWTDRWNAERFLLAQARAFYMHELNEQFFINSTRPFVPDDEH